MTNQDEQKENIQTSVEYLAMLCLQNADVHHEYSDKDLENAVLVFSHFLLDLTYTHNRDLPDDRMLDVAHTTGEAIRELVKVTTGKDMHELVKRP